MPKVHEVAVGADGRAFDQAIRSQIIKPVEQAEKALEQLGDVDAGRGIEKDLDRAQRATQELKAESKDTGDAIRRSFRDAYDGVNREAKQSTGKVKQGFQEAKDEAQQSGREAAASFGGGFDDVADFVQETLANALSGFGPIGAAAGIALAAVLGTVLSNATQAQERLQESRDLAADLASQMYENGGTLPLTERIEELFQTLAEEVAPNGPIQAMIDGWTDFGDRLDGIRRVAERTGRPVSDLVDALTGSDLAATKRELNLVAEELDRMKADPSQGWVWETGPLEDYKRELEGTIKQLELADEITKSSDFLEARRIEELGEAWRNASTDASNYFSQTEDGATQFDWGAYLADAEATIAAADEMKARLVGMPDDIRAEAERVFSEQGAVAANEYTKAYESASANDKRRFENAARQNGTAAGRAQAEGLKTGFGNPEMQARVRVIVDKSEWDSWTPAQKRGTVRALRLDEAV